MKKVELLAPAGSLEGFRGAVHAGADAVYIGGKKYGARAYAENFTDEEVCLAIRYAHLFGRKVYLTVNTLLKDSEMDKLQAYLQPFYEVGLDGIIVQDLGVFSLLREYFPGLALHGSTQMTVTGPRGARFLAEQGASRVVPARELSLEEIKQIKEIGIEVETFIHGAMCYCYSGQCLFSSMLGGRSGNRGKCAQPCRLPYRVVRCEKAPADDGKYPDDVILADKRVLKGKRVPEYPLSLKDMCVLPFLPELIRAGIDSFKIEGRMKKPEYTAGVTAIYRKYIDSYYADPSGHFTVSKEDMERLGSLYIRSEIQEGYYHRHNGKEMITPSNPGYGNTEERYLKQIRETYLEKEPKILIQGEATLKKGEPAVLKLYTDCQEAEEKGEVVQEARKQPLTEESVRKQLCKIGNTVFSLEQFTVKMDEDSFLPVKTLNDLRRNGIRRLEDLIIDHTKTNHLITHKMKTSERITQRTITDKIIPHKTITYDTITNGAITHDSDKETIKTETNATYLAVQILQEPQFRAVCMEPSVNRIYVDGDLITNVSLEKELQQWKKECTGRSLFLVLPYIIRNREEAYLEYLKSQVLSQKIWDGIMIRNLEGLYWAHEIGWKKKRGGSLQADACLYAWNRRSRVFLKEMGVTSTVPLECNREDLRQLEIHGMEMIVYGRIPLMITANCVQKTCLSCQKERLPRDRWQKDGWLWLRDRYGTEFPVRTVCGHCYNEIYNSVPLSLHEYGKAITGEEPCGVRLMFTTESKDEIRQVLSCFDRFVTNPEQKRVADFSFTRGHYKRGAE